MHARSALTLSSVFVIGLSTASYASSHDSGGTVVAANKEYQQEQTGEKSGFGKRISEKSKTKSEEDAFANFGQYLKAMTSQ